MQSKILIIEDDHAITHLLDVALTLDYYNVTTAENATQAHFKIQIDKPDVILLDLGLPDKDGLCLISEIRQHTDIPIIVISARQEEQTIIQALDNGANDYMTKPFNVDELRARIRVIERIAKSHQETNIVFTNGLLSIDFGSKSVVINNQEVHLTPNEFSLLELLSNHKGKVLTYEMILKRIYGYVNKTEMPSLRVHMTSLRQKLSQCHEGAKDIIKTHPRIGYQMLQWKEK
ncbi:response regulator transcription factor [Staphylococcus aureus]|nr:response regulator transcription factor [Staphylococcus aureus]MBX8365382.1 response regulator transcription factor [Staphylococcus aureus]